MQLAQATTWIELTISVGATPLVLLVIYALLSSSLNRGVKVFLTMNGLGLLFLTTSHVSVAVYRLLKPGEWRGADVVANLPLFLHQLAYSSCTVAQFLITIERMIIGLKPRLYVEKRVPQWALITLCIVCEVSIALPCTMLFQDGPVISGHKLYVATELSQKISLLLLSLFDATALLASSISKKVDSLQLQMVIISFLHSSKRYNKHFSNSTLGTRYQVKEVISLTRVLIPICCSSLVFKFAVLILAYFAFGDHKILDLLFTIIRFCCTATAIVEPILLLTRHRLLQRRVRLLLGLPVGEVIQADVRDSVAIADLTRYTFMNLAMLTTYIELAMSVSATPLAVIFLYALITSSLHKGCKTFLVMNGLGLLFLTTSHISVAVYRLLWPGEWRAQDIVANVPLFLHQLAYGTCTVSMILITIERTVIGLHPSLYVEKRIHQWAMIGVCVFSELFIALPCTMLVQDGPIFNGQKLYTTSEMKQKIVILLYTIIDTSAVVMVFIAFLRTSQRYNRVFFKSSLGTRYQIKEVISLTRALIPVCCSSLFFRFTVIILAYFAFGNEQVLDLFFTIIRFCCTAAAIIEPTLLLTKHRILRKRLRILFGLSVGEGMHPIERDPTAIADVYFDAFKKDLNAKTR